MLTMLRSGGARVSADAQKGAFIPARQNTPHSRGAAQRWSNQQLRDGAPGLPSRLSMVKLRSAISAEFDRLPASARAHKPLREFRVSLRDGRDGIVRRPQKADALGLADFMIRTPMGLDFIPPSEAQIVNAVSDAIGNAQTPRHDAFIAVVEGRVVALTEIEPEPHEMERPVSSYFLGEHGLEADEVCVSRMAVTPAERGQGLAHGLKAAQVAASGDAGYKGVVSETSNPAIKAVVKQAGGVVQDSSSAWTLVKTPAAQ